MATPEDGRPEDPLARLGGVGHEEHVGRDAGVHHMQVRAGERATELVGPARGVHPDGLALQVLHDERLQLGNLAVL